MSPEELPFWQPLPPGTTAWRMSMGRRQLVEGANGGLKANFVNIERKWLRVLGLAKTVIMLGFTIAGYNVERIRSFLARTQPDRGRRSPKARRAKRRRGTWTELLGPEPSSPGRDPPAT